VSQPNPEARRGVNSALNDGLSMEEHGPLRLGIDGTTKLTLVEALSHRQLCVLILISNRLKEVTERLMEVEKLLKERSQ